MEGILWEIEPPPQNAEADSKEYTNGSNASKW